MRNVAANQRSTRLPLYIDGVFKIHARGNRAFFRAGIAPSMESQRVPIEPRHTAIDIVYWLQSEEQY